jgi:hypothetical protein
MRRSASFPGESTCCVYLSILLFSFFFLRRGGQTIHSTAQTEKEREREKKGKKKKREKEKEKDVYPSD